MSLDRVHLEGFRLTDDSAHFGIGENGELVIGAGGVGAKAYLTKTQRRLLAVLLLAHDAPGFAEKVAAAVSAEPVGDLMNREAKGNA